MEKIDFRYIASLLKKFGNKYVIVFTLFGIWMVSCDENDLFSRLSYNKKIRKLNQEITYYEKEMDRCRTQKIELESSDENLEKFAREQYLMKKSNEDIFIITE